MQIEVPGRTSDPCSGTIDPFSGESEYWPTDKAKANTGILPLRSSGSE